MTSVLLFNLFGLALQGTQVLLASPLLSSLLNWLRPRQVDPLLRKLYPFSLLNLIQRKRRKNDSTDISSKFKMSLEDVGELLKAIHATLGIEEEKELTFHDQMYSGLNLKGCTFPVHSCQL